MTDDRLRAQWKVRVCPCGRPGCHSAIIEPWIVTLQGCMDKDVAEHIVELHNDWLEGGETTVTQQTQQGKFGPMENDCPSAGIECPACHAAFKEGDYTAVVVLGPGSDPETQEECRQGRPYNAVAVEVHYSCATGEE